ncbi:MAG TPA: hypothetical protein VF408_08450 [Sediminibacterium sp.]
MKYILCILFLALFTGCSTSANRTAGTVNVISISLTDRTGSMFTW